MQIQVAWCSLKLLCLVQRAALSAGWAHVGLRTRNLDVKALQAVFELLQSHYPERLHALWFLNAPFIFWGVWRMVKLSLACDLPQGLLTPSALCMSGRREDKTSVDVQGVRVWVMSIYAHADDAVCAVAGAALHQDRGDKEQDCVPFWIR